MSLFEKQKTIVPKIVVAALLTAIVSVNPANAHAAVSIRDIDLSSDFAKDSIIRLADSGIISGDANGNFAPQRTINRGEMVKILVNALNLDTSEVPENPTFQDVPENHWAFKYVETGYRAGIIKGVSSDAFGINNECTREQMATMFVRSLGLTQEDLEGKQPYLYLGDMSDRDGVSVWAKENVEFALSTGLMNGTGNNRFDAKESAARQQVAVVTDRFITNGDSINRFAGTFRGEMPYPELYNALEENNKHFKGNVDMNMEMNMTDGTEENSFKITMGAKGLVDADIESNLMNFDINYDVGLQLSEDFPMVNQQFQVIKLGDTFYVKESGSDTWTVGTEEDFPDMDLSTAPAGQDSEELIKLYRYSAITKEEGVDFNGTTATKYTMVLSKEAMAALMEGMTADQAAGVEGAAQINDVEGSIVLYLNDQKQIIGQKFDLAGSSWDETMETSFDIHILLDVTYSNIGQNVDIKAPEVAEPIEE